MRTLPAIQLLRFNYPKAHLAWLVEPHSAGAIEGAPEVDEVLIFPRDEINAQFI